MLESEVAESLRRFGLFQQHEVARTSPPYTALCGVVVGDLRAGGPVADVLGYAPARQRIPNLLFAAVHQVLSEGADAPLARYYPSLGGTRTPDAALGATIVDFVAEHRAALRPLLATRETRANEVLRAASLFPAFGWAQARVAGPLALIEVGNSAGPLLHADRHRYRYEFDDGTVLDAGGGLPTACPPWPAARTGSRSPHRN